MKRIGLWLLGSAVLIALSVGSFSPHAAWAQSSASYELVSKAVGTVGGRATSSSYILNGLGGESALGPRTVGEIFGINPGFFSTIDKSGPRFDIFVLQHTIFDRVGAVYVFPSEALESPPAVTLNGSALTLNTLSFATGDVYWQTKVLAIGSNAVQASGTDIWGNPGNSSSSYSVAVFRRQIGGDLASPDGRFRITVGSDALAADATVICQEFDESSLFRLSLIGVEGLPEMPNAESAKRVLEGVAVTPLYTFSEQLAEFHGRTKIEVRYAGLLGDSERPTSLEIYRLSRGTWSRVEDTWLDEENETIVAFADGGGSFQVRLQRTEGDGDGAETGDVPSVYSMDQNFPNPFNPTTRIHFTVPERSRVSLVVFDVRGARIRTLFEGVKDPGRYSEVWNGVDDHGRRVASGVYFYKMETSRFSDTRKMVLLK